MSFGPHPQTLTLRNWAGGSVAPVDHKMHRLSPGSPQSGFISSYVKLFPKAYVPRKSEVLATFEVDTFVYNAVALFGLRVSVENGRKSKKAKALFFKRFAGASVSLRLDDEIVVDKVPFGRCAPLHVGDVVPSKVVFDAIEGDAKVGVFMANCTVATLVVTGLPSLKASYTIGCELDMATYTSKYV